MSENLDSCFPRVLQKLWISALITLRTLLFGFGVNFSPLDKNLISSSKSSLEDKFTILREDNGRERESQCVGRDL